MTMSISPLLFLGYVAAAAVSLSEGFLLVPPHSHASISLSERLARQSTEADSDGHVYFDPNVAKQFKISTCSATSCAAKRKSLALDEYATFSAFWERIQDRIPEVQVEETSCLGACKKSPCVAVEHEEYEGTVALEGMDTFEFADRVFHGVIDDGDADRVWGIVANSIRTMAEQNNDVDFAEL